MHEPDNSNNAYGLQLYRCGVAGMIVGMVIGGAVWSVLPSVVHTTLVGAERDRGIAAATDFIRWAALMLAPFGGFVEGVIIAGRRAGQRKHREKGNPQT